MFLAEDEAFDVGAVSDEDEGGDDEGKDDLWVGMADEVGGDG